MPSILLLQHTVLVVIFSPMKLCTSPNSREDLTTSIPRLVRVNLVKSNEYFLEWHWQSKSSLRIGVSHSSRNDCKFIKLFRLEIYSRPFYALARMILNPDQYSPKNESGPNNLKDQMTEWDVLYQEESNELEAAQEIIRKMFEKLNFDENDLDMKVMLGGDRWMALGDILSGEKLN
jgi:hypothetical protein